MGAKRIARINYNMHFANEISMELNFKGRTSKLVEIIAMIFSLPSICNITVCAICPFTRKANAAATLKDKLSKNIGRK